MKFYNILRRRLNFFVKSILLVSFFFIIYQLTIFVQLLRETNTQTDLLAGTHRYQAPMYKSGDDGKFTCITSMEKIEFSSVNDDYCDCLDGSDEPGTNACPNSQFFCKSQADVPNFKRLVPSSRVNDGICDCCDGSDEWSQKKLGFAFKEDMQKKLGRYFSPCPNFCPE